MSRPSACAALGGESSAERTPEADLVLRAQKDPEAFAALYLQHQAAIARYVARRVGDPHLASDLVAETFLTALEELGRYHHRGLPFRAWLYRLASTRVNRWVRRRMPRPVALSEELVDPARDGAPACDRAIGLAREALLALPPRYQTVIALHHLEGLSVEQVAAALGCRVGTVKARLSRDRARMRKLLAPYSQEIFS